MPNVYKGLFSSDVENVINVPGQIVNRNVVITANFTKKGKTFFLNNCFEKMFICVAKKLFSKQSFSSNFGNFWQIFAKLENMSLNFKNAVSEIYPCT